MLRIVLGFRTHGRMETPEVIYCGHDGAASQAAIDTAPAAIIRFERLEGVHGFPGRRMPGSVPMEPVLAEPLQDRLNEVLSQLEGALHANEKLQAAFDDLGRQAIDAADMLKLALEDNDKLKAQLAELTKPAEVLTAKTEENPASTDAPVGGAESVASESEATPPAAAEQPGEDSPTAKRSKK